MLGLIKPHHIQDPVEIGHWLSKFVTIFPVQGIKAVIEVFAC
jgi:hypothetical protein